MELGKLRTLWEATSATLTHRGHQREPLNPCKKPVGLCQGPWLLLEEYYFPEGFKSHRRGK